MYEHDWPHFLFSFQPTKDELQKLSNSFSDQSSLQMTGVCIGGEKFFYLSGTEKVRVGLILCTLSLECSAQCVLFIIVETRKR